MENESNISLGGAGICEMLRNKALKKCHLERIINDTQKNWYSLLYSSVRKRHKIKPKEANEDYFQVFKLSHDQDPILSKYQTIWSSFRMITLIWTMVTGIQIPNTPTGNYPDETGYRLIPIITIIRKCGKVNNVDFLTYSCGEFFVDFLFLFKDKLPIECCMLL